ncbi:ABC-three component system protein [Klebsiella pneumoniae]|uniref:ABC-three component system protein n=1 Tax=Klebsiella pneumoniae TaxID=573 RepID=UPI00350F9EB2
MSMLIWKKKNNAKHLILFIHGLKGGSDTWAVDKITSFPQLICEDEDFCDAFDIACFEYFTNFTNTYGKSRNLLAGLFTSLTKKEVNLPVDELSELLVGECQINLSDYSNIIFVAHSMGGLIAKSCIIKMHERDLSHNITGFISLAVPHSGSETASWASMVSSNVQLGDLSVFSKETDSLNRRWVKLPKLPELKFLYGSYDSIVVKASAIPVQVSAKESIAVQEDHSTICKPKDRDSNVYLIVKKLALEIHNKTELISSSPEFKDDKQYDNEFFVLKMIVADVHSDISKHAKEYYYNAELARNIFTSDRDRETLSVLYRKIREIYQTQYHDSIANHNTANQLLAAIHKKIEDEDKVKLSSLLDTLDSVHKKGMLHQLANKLDRDIIWSPDTSLDSLDSLRGQK